LQEQFDETVQTAQKLLNCHSWEDISQVHTEFLQQSFERLVQHATALAQSAARSAQNINAPLGDQFDTLVQKFYAQNAV
jgi:phasin family protein